MMAPSLDQLRAAGRHASRPDRLPPSASPATDGIEESKSDGADRPTPSSTLARPPPPRGPPPAAVLARPAPPSKPPPDVLSRPRAISSDSEPEDALPQPGAELDVLDLESSPAAAAAASEDQDKPAAPEAFAPSSALFEPEGDLPPPPPSDDEHEDEGALVPSLAFAGLPSDEDLGVGPARFRHVRPGRFSLFLYGGEAIFKPDRRGQSTKIDPYVKFEVGRGSAHPLRTKSTVAKNSSATPSWRGECIQIDISDPLPLVVDDTISLNFEVWDNNIFSDELLGEGSLSILRLFEYVVPPGTDPSDLRQHWLPLTLTPKVRRGGQVARPEPAGKILVGVQFQPVQPGLLVVTTIEGIGLRNMDMFGEQDPYTVLEFDDQRVRGTTVPRGGKNPFFNNEELDLVITRDNWSKPLKISLFDEDPGRDDFIGECMLSVLDLTNLAPGEAGAIENVFVLHAAKKDAGKVRFGFRFYPAGRLTIEVSEGRRLANREVVGQMDPYVKLQVGGSPHTLEFKTKVDTDGGSNPVWNETARFDVIDQHEVRVEVWDKDLLSADDLVGACLFSLLPVFKTGYKDSWHRLTRRTTWGKMESAGEVFLKVDFSGAKGVAFPQRQPDMDRFDERDRVTRSGDRVADLQRQEEQGLSAADDDVDPADLVPKAEFTEHEVEEAFDFLDLDKNLFLSAAEIRHVLICMGELITDEEIDEMVRMVDADGDGQVSFDEFHRLAMHPDPASVEFDLLVRGKTEDDDDEDGAASSSAAAGPSTALALRPGRAPPPPPIASGPVKSSAAAAAREKQTVSERKKFLKQFTEDQRLRVPDLQKAWERLLADRPMPAGGASKGWSDAVSFQEMCDLFGAEPTGEARQLYNVFVDAEIGRVPLRRLLMALCSFCSTDRNQRINFCFYLFDDDKSGSIDEMELREILRANHLASEASQVESKARHVLAQGDKDGDGTIDMDEFVILANKMPNLIFPQYDLD
jgi:Ca2+-binding EF-hand superfamily protein